MLFRFVSSPWTGPIRRSGVIISHIDMIESSWVPPVSFGNVRPSFLVTGPEGPVFPFQFTLRCCLVCKVHRLKSRGHIRAETGISGIKLTFPCRIRNRPPLRIIHVSDFFLCYIGFSIAPFQHSTASASYSLCAIQPVSSIGDRPVCCEQGKILCGHWITETNLFM